MTTYFPLVISSQQAPAFTPTFDNVQYRVVVTWNIAGQRFYINIYTMSNQLIVAKALTQTESSLTLETLAWDQNNNVVDAVTSLPHGWTVGNVVNLTISNANPDVYNGEFPCLITGPNTFTYPLDEFPDYCLAPGNVGYFNSLTDGYFNSTMIFRNNMFEVSP